VQGHYWNEYDDGSEAGDIDGGYVIYIDPDDDTLIPGIPRLLHWVSMPVTKVKSWFGRSPPEREPLLSPTDSNMRSAYGTSSTRGTSPRAPGSVSSPTAVGDEDEDEFASDVEMFPGGYETYIAALPSVDQQMMTRYREHVLFWSTIGSFAASLLFLGVAAVLVSTGRHRLRAEVDAGATVGVIASLMCAAVGLGLSMARKDDLGLVNRLVLWGVFTAACVLNGMLLVIVVGNSSL
jgi:hypothetical protein